MAWIRLLRLPLLPSAFCDILCGAALAGGLDRNQFPILLVLLAGSALLYLSGMVWNDVADAERDRTLGARRPIAEGEIPRLAAAVLALILMGGGLWCLAWDPVWPLALYLALGILLYDFLGNRRPWLGAPLLGTVRAANLLVGMIGMGSLPAHPDLWIPALYGLSIALIVGHGSLEDRQGIQALQRGVQLRLLAVPLPFLCALVLPHPWLVVLGASPQAFLLLRSVTQTSPSTAAGTGLLLRGISRFTAAASLGTGQWILAGACLLLAWAVPPLLGRIRWS